MIRKFKINIPFELDKDTIKEFLEYVKKDDYEHYDFSRVFSSLDKLSSKKKFLIGFSIGFILTSMYIVLNFIF